MPFKETCVADEKVRFIAARLKGDMTMTQLCEAFGISREWGYELLRRFDRRYIWLAAALAGSAATWSCHGEGDCV